tara:strand:- start:475 stop:711 length:237 start_codon:yes stop_codon:yes gene_type:complete
MDKIEVIEATAAADAALVNGTLTQVNPLALNALRVAIRYERFGQFTVPSQAATDAIDAEAMRRFAALPRGNFSVHWKA